MVSRQGGGRNNICIKIHIYRLYRRHGSLLRPVPRTSSRSRESPALKMAGGTDADSVDERKRVEVRVAAGSYNEELQPAGCASKDL